MMPILTRACPLCEACCGLLIAYSEGKVGKIEGDPDDPLSAGYLCPKGASLGELYHDPDRLVRPQIRQNGTWRQVSWQEGLDFAAQGLAAVRQKYGRNGNAVFLGNPTVHSYGALMFAPDLIHALGTCNRFSASSLDQWPHMLVSRLMFGHQLLLPVPDVDRTDCMIIMGGNPVVSNGSLMTAPGMKLRLKKIQQRGGKVVVIDPRRTETAKLADQHVFVRPGTDHWLLLYWLQKLLGQPQKDLGHLAAALSGLEEVRQVVSDLPLPDLHERCGIETGVADQLLEMFQTCERAVLYGRLGISVHPFGSLNVWLINMINLLAGHLDCEGGAMFPKAVLDLTHWQKPAGLGRWHSRIHGLPEFGGELSSGVLADEMLQAGEGAIRGLLTLAGNPALSVPGTDLPRALEQLEFMVSIDIYLNETSRHADVILPPTLSIEEDGFDIAFQGLMVQNYIRYDAAGLPADPATMSQWRIIAELTRRLRCGSARKKWEDRFKRLLGPRRLLALGIRQAKRRYPDGGRITLGSLKKHPHGIVLQPLQPCLPGRIVGQDKIDLLPDMIVTELSRLDVDNAAGSPALQLVGRRDLRSNNSWMHNLPRLGAGQNRCTLLVHPADAAGAGIQDADRALLSAGDVSLRVRVCVTDDVMPGVVCLPHGWGHDAADTGLSVAAERPGVNYNALGNPGNMDAASATVVLNGWEVSLSPLPA